MANPKNKSRLLLNAKNLESAPTWIKRAKCALDAGGRKDFAEALAKARRSSPDFARTRLDLFQSQYMGNQWVRNRIKTNLRAFLSEQLSRPTPGLAKVKAEPGSPSRDQDRGKPERKPEGRKQARAQKAKVATGYARGAREHYRYQVALIDSLVPPPWDVCFGALGSGIIGVVPSKKKTRVKKEPKDQDKPQNGSASAASSSATPASSQVKEEGQDDDDDDAVPAIPANATVILLINSQAWKTQTRNGKCMGAYEESLDAEGSTLRWSSQRRDRHSKMLGTILGHCRRGGRVTVACRGSANLAEEDSMHFRVLGDVARMDDVRLARFLVEDGDQVILERGTDVIHKQILPSCLNTGLKSGVGLTCTRAKVDTVSKLKNKWCMTCCYEPPSALLHFKELNREGVDVYVTKQEKRPRTKAERVKTEAGKAKQEVVKQEVVVKKEEKDEMADVDALVKEIMGSSADAAGGEKRRKISHKQPIIKKELLEVATPARGNSAALGDDPGAAAPQLVLQSPAIKQEPLEPREEPSEPLHFL